jgi:hypothetical protein
MVCFEIELSLFILPKANRNALDQRVQHLMRHCNADIQKLSQTDSSIEYKFRVCDESATSLLRDFPTPFNVKKITILRTGETLYLYRHHHEPPQIPLLKNVYWLAKSTERWRI